jgi:hypothetical protein
VNSALRRTPRPDAVKLLFWHAPFSSPAVAPLSRKKCRSFKFRVRSPEMAMPDVAKMTFRKNDSFLIKD